MFDLETFIELRAVPFANGIYERSKILGKYNRDKSKKNQKFPNDCVVSKGTDCNNKMLDHVFCSKPNQKKLRTKMLNIIYTCTLKKAVVAIFLL